MLLTPVFATLPKNRSRKSCVCHTCDPLPPPPFHLLLLFLLSTRVTRHFQVPSLVVANLPLYFQAVAGCSPRNPFLFMLLHGSRGWGWASPQGMRPSAQCSLSRIPAQSRHLRSPHLRFQHPARAHSGIANREIHPAKIRGMDRR